MGNNESNPDTMNIQQPSQKQYVIQLLQRSCQQNGKSIAYVDKNISRNYLQMFDRVRKLATGLVNNGLTNGGRVAIISLNSYQYMEAMFAINYAGGIFLPI